MSPIRRLLAAACASRPFEAGDNPGALEPAQVRRHMLGPLAHELGAAGFERDHLASSLLAERRTADATEAVSAIARGGIPVMLIKGIAYAGRLYRDPATRPMSDIDLLVPADAQLEAVRRLGQLGYWRAGEASERTPFHHAITLKRRAGAIDLHRSIVQPLRAGARIPGLWQRASRAPISGALLPDPIDEAVIGLAHIARSELMVPAINLVDASRLLARAEVGGVIARADAVGLGRGVAAVIALVASVDSPTEASRLLPDLDSILAGERPSRAVQLARKLALTSGVADALRLATNAALEALR